MNFEINDTEVVSPNACDGIQVVILTIISNHVCISERVNNDVANGSVRDAKTIQLLNFKRKVLFAVWREKVMSTLNT